MNLFHILPVVLRNMDTFRSNIHGKYPRAGLTMFYSLSLSLYLSILASVLGMRWISTQSTTRETNQDLIFNTDDT
jgi:hypothetical protein